MGSYDKLWGPTALYRLFDAGGALLYVGISAQPPVRYKQHAGDKPWWPEVATKTEEWHGDRRTALRFETAAIAAELSRYNRLGMPDYPPKAPDDGKSVSVAGFRAKFTDYINWTRYGDRMTFVYSRARRVAVVAPTELGELAEAVGGPAAAVQILKAHLASKQS